MPESPISLAAALGSYSAATLQGDPATSFVAVACHPVQVNRPGTLFVCMDEYLEYNRWQTWRTHLEALPALELAAVVAPEPIPGLDIPQVITPEPRKVCGLLSRELFERPDQRIPVYGVTGTNGKTTTTRMLAHALGQLGTPCGSVGTLGVELKGSLAREGTYTTPLAPQLQADLDELIAAGSRAASIEVSSHALALDRVAGMCFSGAILTNIERDHLDFHGTREAYAEAKRLLFTLVSPGGVCVLNQSCPFTPLIAATCSGEVVTYGRRGSGADLTLESWELDAAQSAFTLGFRGQKADFVTRLPGLFQVENAMGVIALLAAQGIPLVDLVPALADFPPVCGRMERIPLPNGATAIVDYAHNPDGLRHLLTNCRQLCSGRLHVVFGCGGDRDRGKRPLMGELADQLADVVWVTSDNPRTEDPEAIIQDVLAGFHPPADSHRIHCLTDRAAAIRAAYADTQPGDLLIVAGKGHEDYQIIGFTRIHFSDQEILRSFSPAAGA